MIFTSLISFGGANNGDIDTLTNVLQIVFTSEDPKNEKRHWKLDCLFSLLESLQVKAACKTMVKLTLVVNFINILLMNFLY